MGQSGKAADASGGQSPAPIGSVPVPGETWHPVGRKALVGAAFLKMALSDDDQIFFFR